MSDPRDAVGMHRPRDDADTYIAQTNFRNVPRTFGIKRTDRLSHMYMIGKTGTGKSTLLETLIRQDMAQGEGVCLLDPHGDLAERVAGHVPGHRRGDVVYLDAPDPRQPYGYNPLRRVHPAKRPLAAAGLLEVFHKAWGERAWGQRMEHILRNVLLALLDQPDATLADIPRLFQDARYRKAVAAAATNQHVRAFWTEEFPKYAYRYRAEAVAPIQNKVGAFLTVPAIARILTTAPRPISLRALMDRGGILLVNLARGKLGEDATALLGGMLLTSIGLAAFSRADLPAAARRPFFVHLDEFQYFTTRSVATMIAELRKYAVGLVLANQYLGQLDDDIRDAVLGNAGTLIAFRVGPQDAAFLAREFEAKFEALDLLTLPNRQIYLKLMVDGAPTKPFSAETLAPSDLL
jgi:hypothetical protein